MLPSGLVTPTLAGRQAGDWTNFIMSLSTVTAVRMRFPANRKFVFKIEYEVGDEDVVDVSIGQCLVA